MPVPKRRTTRAKRDQRRAQHDRAPLPGRSICPHCGEPALPHRVCPSCGFYKGRKVMAGARDEEEALAQQASGD